STSNCTTFQARRLNIRRRTEAGTEPVATLNGTLCAVARTIACLLDHHQQPDGTVYLPEALRPWLGGRRGPAPPWPAPVLVTRSHISGPVTKTVEFGCWPPTSTARWCAATARCRPRLARRCAGPPTPACSSPS